MYHLQFSNTISIPCTRQCLNTFVISIIRRYFSKYYVVSGENVKFPPPIQDLHKTGHPQNAANVLKLPKPNPYTLRQLHAKQNPKTGDADKFINPFANKTTPQVNRNMGQIRANQIVKTNSTCDKQASGSLANKTAPQIVRNIYDKPTEATSSKYDDVLEGLEINDNDFTEDIFAETQVDPKNSNGTKSKETSPNLFSSGEAGNKQVKPSKVGDIEFSQFCMETAVMRQIDNLISPIKPFQTNKAEAPTPTASQTKRKSLEDHGDAKSKRSSLGGPPKDVVALDYRLEVSQFFEETEQSIYQLGPNQDKNLLPDQAVLNHKRTCLNTMIAPAENMEKVKILQNITLPNISKWLDDSFMNDAKDISKTQNEIQKVLLENARKDIERKVVMNRTLVTSQARFRELGPFYGLPNKVMELIQSYRGITKLYGEYLRFLYVS